MTEARESFVRLAEARTHKALEAIRLIGNLSNPTNYSYTEQDVEEIFRALNEGIKEARARFKQSGPKDATRFQLSSR